MEGEVSKLLFQAARARGCGCGAERSAAGTGCAGTEREQGPAIAKKRMGRAAMSLSPHRHGPRSSVSGHHICSPLHHSPHQLLRALPATPPSPGSRAAPEPVPPLLLLRAVLHPSLQELAGLRAILHSCWQVLCSDIASFRALPFPRGRLCWELFPQGTAPGEPWLCPGVQQWSEPRARVPPLPWAGLGAHTPRWLCSTSTKCCSQTCSSS